MQRKGETFGWNIATNINKSILTVNDWLTLSCLRNVSKACKNKKEHIVDLFTDD